LVVNMEFRIGHWRVRELRLTWNKSADSNREPT
jgi:hypothetical protein